MTLDCCVISLPRTHERAMRICARLADLGIEYTVFPAVDSASDEHCAWANYDDALCRKRFGAQLMPAEIGAYASHYSLWQRCAANARPMLILEDDAILLDGFAEAVALAEIHIASCGMIRLAGLVERRYRIVADLGRWRVVRLLRGPMGTQAYCLSADAARALVRGAAHWVEPVDLYVDRFWTHGVLPHAILPYPVIHPDESEVPSTMDAARFAKRKGWSKLRREWRRVRDNAARRVFNLTN